MITQLILLVCCLVSIAILIYVASIGFIDKEYGITSFFVLCIFALSISSGLLMSDIFNSDSDFCNQSNQVIVDNECYWLGEKINV